MPFSITKLALALSIAATTIQASPIVETRTLTKANEYRSSDCSGQMNYHHRPGWGGFLTYACTKMDPTSHSVYINAGTLGAGYRAYSSFDCSGDPIGPTGQSPYLQGANGKKPCVDLDRALVPVGVADGSAYRIGSILYIEDNQTTPQ